MNLKQLLARHEFVPKKSLGQNFITDRNLLNRIVDVAEISDVDEVLEIGPGLGTLTEILAEEARRVVAVELDDRLLPLLRERLDSKSNVHLIHGDILEQDLGAVVADGYKVVANIPYYITGAIVRKLLSKPPFPSTIVLTMQLEVAQRLAAEPPNMNMLAVLAQSSGRAELKFTIAAGAFWPRPDVAAGVVKLTRDLERDFDPGREKLLLRVAKIAFQQKRKQLGKTLRALGLDQQSLNRALSNASIDATRRPQTVSVDEWRQLCHYLVAAGLT